MNGSNLYSTMDLQILILNTTGSALQILPLFAFPGVSGLAPSFSGMVGAIVGSVVGITTGQAGVGA